MSEEVGRPTRAARVGESVKLEPGGVEVDPTTGRYLAADGSRGRLTAIERKLLVVLLAHRGEVVSRDKLFAATHGGALADPGGLRAVDQAVSRLRRRLFGKHDGLVAVRGLGYRLVGAPVDTKPTVMTIVGR